MMTLVYRPGVVASDLEGALSTGAQWRGIGRYLVANGRALAYRLFLTQLGR